MVTVLPRSRLTLRMAQSSSVVAFSTQRQGRLLSRTRGPRPQECGHRFGTASSLRFAPRVFAALAQRRALRARSRRTSARGSGFASHVRLASAQPVESVRRALDQLLELAFRSELLSSVELTDWSLVAKPAWSKRVDQGAKYRGGGVWPQRGSGCAPSSKLSRAPRSIFSNGSQGESHASPSSSRLCT